MDLDPGSLDLDQNELVGTVPNVAFPNVTCPNQKKMDFGDNHLKGSILVTTILRARYLGFCPVSKDSMFLISAIILFLIIHFLRQYQKPLPIGAYLVLISHTFTGAIKET